MFAAMINPYSSYPARKGMTLIEVTVVVLVLLSLLMVLFIGAQAYKRGSDRTGCIMNIRNTQQAVRSYQNMNRYVEGRSLDVAVELVGDGKLMEAWPTCPGIGIYSYGSEIPPTGTLLMSCSLKITKDHSPNTFGGW